MDEPWQPANPVESALRDALEAGDEGQYLAVLAEAVLLVPVVPEESAERPVLGVMRLDDGAEVVPAYTSAEAMEAPEAERLTERHIAIPFAELAARWPSPRYALAVDPGLPVAAHLSGAELSVLVGSVFAPVNEVERRLAATREPADRLAALASADLHLPVRAGTAGQLDLRDPAFPWWRGWSGTDDVPAVPVFTSPERLRGCLGPAESAPESVVVDLSALAAAWPDPRWFLTVNPTAPYAVTVTGDHLVATFHPDRHQSTPT